MPNLLAHNLLIKRFYLKEDNYGTFSDNSFIHGNFDFLSWGTQGPDPLFYMGIVPFHGLHIPTALKKIGNQIHKTDGKKFFRLLVERSYGIEDEKDRSRFQSFIFGQFAHYILDRESHPYIIYESGFEAESGAIHGPYHFLHANFEANIDFCLAKKFKMNYFLSNPSDALPYDKRFLSILDRELIPVLKQLFDIKKLPKHMYTNAIVNMKSVVKYVNHNPGWKKKLLPKRIMGVSMPLENQLDFPECLNESKKIWLDPVTGDKHNDSFVEIHARAFEIIESCYHDILKNGFNYEVILKYLNGLNYYGTPVSSKWVYQKN
ncbi:MAG: hypothetical protein WCR67_03795 [Bacilli bacterium]